MKREMEEHNLTLPLLLHTKKGMASTLRFLESTKVGTRKWKLGQEHDD